MRKSMILLLVLAVSSVACGPLSFLGNDGHSRRPVETPIPNVEVQREGNTVVLPESIDDYLTNPGMGWQHFEALGDPLLPETVLYPDRSLISWRVLQPAADEFNWEPLDNFIAQVTAANMQVGFRVYTMRGESVGGQQLPAWVLEDGAALINNFEVDYSNCTYQEHWGNFVDALRERYDGNPYIAAIDISGYGNFNEWSWQDSQTEWDDDALNPDTLDGQARKRLAEMFIGGLESEHECRTADGTVQTVEYDYPGFEETQLVMPFAGIQQSTEYVVAQRDDVGIRFDCLGDADITEGLLERISDELEAVWPYAPVMFEFCGVSTEPQFLEVAEELLRVGHGTLVHDNTVEPRTAAPVEDLMRLVGYRFVLGEAIYPPVLTAGQTHVMETTWYNVGYAPVYRKMGQEFELRMALLDEANMPIFEHTFPAQIHRWMPAETVPGLPPENPVGREFEVPADLTPGSYTMAVGIFDTRTGLPVNLAIAGRVDGGWYALGPVDVAPPPEAGAVDG